MILRLCWIQFWQPRRKLQDNWPKFFRWVSENGLTFLFTEENLSPWKGRLLFRRLLLKFFDERPFCSAHCPEMKRKSWKVFFLLLLSSNCSCGQVECNFENPYKNILQEGREIFPHFPKLIRNSKFFGTSNFYPTCSSAHVKSYFGQHLKKLQQQAEKVCSTFKNDRKSTVFLEVFSINCCYGQVEWKHLSKPDEKSWAEGRKTYAHCPKMKKELWFDRTLFPQKCSQGQVKRNFVNPSEAVPLKAKIITVNVR